MHCGTVPGYDEPLQSSQPREGDLPLLAAVSLVTQQHGQGLTPLAPPFGRPIKRWPMRRRGAGDWVRCARRLAHVEGRRGSRGTLGEDQVVRTLTLNIFTVIANNPPASYLRRWIPSWKGNSPTEVHIGQSITPACCHLQLSVGHWPSPALCLPVPFLPLNSPPSPRSASSSPADLTEPSESGPEPSVMLPNLNATSCRFKPATFPQPGAWAEDPVLRRTCKSVWTAWQTGTGPSTGPTLPLRSSVHERAGASWSLDRSDRPRT